MSIYERTVEDADLEAALEAREAAKGRRGEAQKAFTKADEQAKAKLEGLELDDGSPVRIGRFVVTVKAQPGKSVSFETAPSERLQISLLKEG